MHKTIPFTLRAPKTASEIEKRRNLREAIEANPYLILHAMALGEEAAQLDTNESGPGHCARHHSIPSELQPTDRRNYTEEVIDEPDVRPSVKSYITPIDHEDFC